ncbi:hypothetical protein JCM18899A_44610 [Nocardioides sp. AN3]
MSAFRAAGEDALSWPSPKQGPVSNPGAVIVRQRDECRHDVLPAGVAGAEATGQCSGDLEPNRVVGMVEAHSVEDDLGGPRVPGMAEVGSRHEWSLRAVSFRQRQ